MIVGRSGLRERQDWAECEPREPVTRSRRPPRVRMEGGRLSPMACAVLLVHDELEGSGPFHRQVPRLRPFEDPVDVGRRQLSGPSRLQGCGPALDVPGGTPRCPERLERRTGGRAPGTSIPMRGTFAIPWPSAPRGTARSPASKNRRRFMGASHWQMIDRCGASVACPSVRQRSRGRMGIRRRPDKTSGPRLGEATLAYGHPWRKLS